MTQLPTDRTSANTVAEHVADHNTLATEHNELDGHAAATTTVHGITNTSALETTTGSAAKVAAHEADTTAVHGITDTSALVTTSDSRLTDARTPTSHHTSHEAGGGDAMAVDAAAATASLRTLGTGAAQACAGNDSRLSDTRTPTDGSVTNAKVSASAAIAKSKLAALAIVDADVDAAAAIAESKLSLASDAAAGTASRRTLGTGATQAAVGSHAHSGTYEPAGTVATHAAAADPHTGYVLESLIDAAGDLIVGTADNAVGRLGMGAALTVLRVNAGATALEFAAPAAAGDMTFARFAFR